MSSDLYFFLTDESFANLPTKSVVKYSVMNDYGMGLLDDDLLNYFVEHSVFLDPVNNENIRRRTRVNVDRSTNVVPNGRMMLHFDAKKLLDDGSSDFSTELIKGFVIAEDDTNVTAKRARLSSLFNILDTVFHARHADESLMPVNELEAILGGDENDSTFMGYVKNSLKVSVRATAAKVRLGDGLSPLRDHYNSCSFKYTFNYDETEVTLTFHVWLNSDEFKANYPYSTIVDYIPPCKPEWILNPTSYGSQIQAVLESSDYVNDLVDEAVTSGDHSGAVEFATTWKHNARVMKFLVLYKGREPDASAMRSYIRTQLLSLKKANGSPLADYATWRNTLPDLFVDMTWYLIPIFSQIVPYPMSVVERAVVSYQQILNEVRTVLTMDNNEQLIDDASIVANMELTSAPGHRMTIAAIPTASTITNNGKRLEELFPTYQAVSGIYQERYNTMTALTKQFAQKLDTCLTACLGLGVSNDLVSDNIGGKPAYSFVVVDAVEGLSVSFSMLVNPNN